MISLFLPLAHGLLIGRQDLPIPAWLFAWGASLVLIVSFVALSVAWRDSKFSSDRWRPVSERLSRPVTGRARPRSSPGRSASSCSAAVVYTGLEGTDEPNLNFAVTFVFVTFWLGMVVLSILLGDVFRAFNPWRAIARTVGAVFRLIAGQPHLAAAPLSGAARALAGGRRDRRLRLARAGLRRPAALGPSACSRATVAVATLAYTAYTLRRDGPVRGRDLASARGGVLRLLRDVLPARSARGPRGAARDPPPAGRGHALGPGPRIASRWSSRRSAQHDLRRRPGGAVAGADPQTCSTVSPTSGSGRPPPSGPRSRSSSRSPWRGWRRSTGRACAGCGPCAARRR